MQSVEEQLFQYEQRAIQTGTGATSNKEVLLNNKAEDLMYAMRSKSDQQSYKYLFYGIIIVTMISAVSHIVFLGYWAGICGMVLGIGIYFFGHSRVKAAVLSLKSSGKDPNSNKIEDRLAYLDLGLDIKDVRIKVLRFSYAILLSVNLVVFSELILGRLGLIPIAIAVVIGLITWFFLFQNDFHQIYEFDEKIEGLRDEAVLSELFID